MPRQANEIATEFIRQVDTLEVTRAKMENLAHRGEIEVDDIEHVYCGLYLEAFTLFEALIEDLFFGLILGNLVSARPDVVLRVSINPSATVQEILLIGKTYMEWLPYADNTIVRAKVFFQDGYPFARLDNANKFNLTRFHKIRNAIGHKSDYAKKKFEQDVLGSSTLTPRERRPGGFLRSVFRRPSQTQYQVAVEELKVIATTLCN